MSDPVADRGSGPLLGKLLDLDIAGPAQGGACVARHGDGAEGTGGRVVFVRHALPGERVRALVTEDRGGSFCRADAIEILAASPDRVEAPCPYAGPGRCGGCDWQHATAPAQHAVKTTVLRDQFARFAGLDLDGVFAGVEALPGGLLGWRTRIVYAVGRDGRPGLRRHGSHDIEHIAQCALGVAGVGDAAVLSTTWPGLSGVEVTRGADSEDGGRDNSTVLAHRPGRGRQARGRRPPDRIEVLSGPAILRQVLHGREFNVAADGFWQVHPAAAESLTAAVLGALGPLAGATVLDLYAGAGALTATLAEAVGADGQVLGIEHDVRAVADAAANLADLRWAEVRHGRVTSATVRALDLRPDVVVLDPPRAGAGREVVSALTALAPRAICYVSCDGATLARDIATARGLGWRLHALRAFDAFPMTQHVECVATLHPGAGTDSAAESP